MVAIVFIIIIIIIIIIVLIVFIFSVLPWLYTLIHIYETLLLSLLFRTHVKRIIITIIIIIS
jgi:hypothetical protein